MTISTTSRKAGPFSGNGVTTAFPFVFKVFAKADLKVVKTSTTNVDSTLVLDSNYSVTLNADQDATPGGTVTYSLLATGEKLTIVGNMPVTQPADITNGSGFYASVVEQALDRNVMSMQQIGNNIDRAIKFPVSDAVLPLDLPPAAARIGRALVFGPAGEVGVSASTYNDQAGAAAGSAAAAAASAVAANGSAVAAAGSAGAASTSASNALASELAAAATYDNFDDRYLGPKASNPTLDNDGNPLLNGAMYFNSTLGIMMVYNTANSSWQSAGATGIRQVYNFVAGTDFTAGTTTTLTLPANPLAEENLMIFFGTASTQTYVPHTAYTLAGTVVTFSSPITSGTTMVEVVATSNSSYGPQGIQGTAGNTILSGIGAPGAGLGVTSDFYINRTNYDFYEKVAGTWTLRTSLIGPNGAGTGNVLGTGASITDEVVLFSGTTGQQLKRATFSGLLKLTSGVASAAVPGTDYVGPTSGSAVQKANGAGGLTTAVAATDYAAPGSITTSGITQNTARILGRSTAAAGAVEEIAIGTGLALAAGVLSWTGSVGDHEVSVSTGNGYGSTANKIRRFTTTVTNVGTAITYADSASQGAAFTINESGIYNIYYIDSASPSIDFGASKNSASLTTSIFSLPYTEKLGSITNADGGSTASFNRVVRLTAGDVIRPHTSGTASPSTSPATSFFAIRKVNT